MIFKNPILGQNIYPLLRVLPASYSTMKEDILYILTYMFFKKSTTLKKNTILFLKNNSILHICLLNSNKSCG